MNKTIIICATALLGFAAFAQGRQGMGRRMRENPDAKLHRFSTTVEKERPQLNDETKRLIAAYHRNPRSLGDRPHESLIFQCFPGIGSVATPILSSLPASRRSSTP